MVQGNEAAEPQKRRRGRPRKDEGSRDVRRAEIVNAAIRLFAEQSYRETTMSDIAAAIGLNQSSLYYWFKDKESLLETILQDNTASLELASVLSMLPGEHPLHLYAVVYTDAMMMCSYPFDYYELEDAAMSHPSRFVKFFDTYRSLRETIQKIISSGIKAGDFPETVDPVLATNAALSLTEGLQHQYHQAKTVASPEEAGAWGGIELQSADALARLAADSVLIAVSSGIKAEGMYEEAVERGWIVTSG